MHIRPSRQHSACSWLTLEIDSVYGRERRLTSIRSFIISETPDSLSFRGNLNRGR
jgi:hypothetical protein